MNRFIFKLTLAVLLTLGILGSALTGNGWGLTGPIETGSATLVRKEADKVHLILTGFTGVKDKDIGPDCRADLIAVQALFSWTFRGEWRNRLEVHPLYGESWTADKVQQYLRDMKIGSNDVVVFYHAGHGGIQDSERPADTHILQVNASHLRRGDVRRLLLDRNCRGIILLTDTCSTLPKTGRALSRSMAAEDNPSKPNRETIRNLFLRFKGLVDITAAEVGQPAGNNFIDDFAGARGAFTAAFLKLASQRQTFTTWKDFFPALRALTRQASRGDHQAQAFTIREETVSATTPAQTQPTTGPITTGPIPDATISQNR